MVSELALTRSLDCEAGTFSVVFPPLICHGKGVREETLYSQKKALALGVPTGVGQVERYGVEEIKVDASGTYDNPFDPSDVKLDAEVTPPMGSPYTMPGFLYRSFQRKLEHEAETLIPEGEADWRIRISPSVVGHYSVKIKFQDRSGETEKRFSFDSIAGSLHGPIRVSPIDRHYFEYQDGSSYFPVGANVCWAGPRGTFDYDDWLPNYGKNGCNYTRLWLGPSWSPFSLERKGEPKAGLGAGMIDLAAAWRLDRVLSLAGANSMSALLSLDSFDEFQIRDDRPDWMENPLNRDNGGPLRVWTEFWSSPVAAKLYDDKLRYLVARYAADEHVMGWELWNDVDLVPEYDAPVVRAWHAKVAGRLKELDPYHHLVTTSFSQPRADRDTFLLSGIDFDQIHAVSPQMVGVIADVLQRRSEWGKPSYVGQIEGDLHSPHAAEDSLGVQVHDPLWISALTGGAGGAMPWYWDSLIAANNLYGLFDSFAKWVNDIDFPKEAFRSSDASIQPADLNIWTLVGNDVALAWVQPKNRSWQSVVIEKVPTMLTGPSVATLNNLATGNWKAEVWDTWRGTPTTSFTIHVGLDGKAALHLPGFNRDVAVKLRRVKS